MKTPRSALLAIIGLLLMFMFIPTLSWASDNCPTIANVDQADTDGDGIGDVCDIQVPTIAASDITADSTFSDRLQINFTPGDGARHLVVMRAGSAVNWSPTDTAEYSGSLNFTQAADLGDGNKIVGAGPQTQLNVTGLQPNITYHIKVFEYNGTGEQTLYLVAGAPVSSKKTLALPLVYVTSPGNNSINQKWNPNVTAREVVGATTYTIELNSSADFSGESIVQAGSRTQSFAGLGFGTKYYTRVKTDLRPDYGKVTNFTTALPEHFSYVRSPGNNATNIKVNLNILANVVPDATEYTIQLSEYADFSEIAFEGNAETNTMAFSGLKYGTTYFNRVRTNLSAPDSWGATRSFTTRTAESISYVTSPANGSTGKNTNLNITANLVPNATEYTIQLSETEDFAVVAFEVTGPTRTLAFSGLKYNTTYYSRVRTNMSGTGEDCLDQCTIESFECVEAADGDGDAIVLCEITYEACIASCSDGWGETRSFSTRTAESISYVTSPANGSVDRNITLNITANNVPGAAEYTIQLSESPDFSVIAFEGFSSTRTVAFSGLKYNTVYYNRVRTDMSGFDGNCLTNCEEASFECVEAAAGDPELIVLCEENYNTCLVSCAGGWGETRSFRTRTAESISYVTSPASGSTDRNTTLNISSSNVPGASLYTIQLSETEDFAEVAFEVSGPTRTLAFSGLNYNTTYYSRVRTDMSGNLQCFETCEIESFICVDEALGDPGALTACEEAYESCIGNCSDGWGPTRSFTTRSPESISYVTSPANNAINRSTVLNISSNNVPGASEYTIQLSEDSLFSVIHFEVTGPIRTLAFSGLSYNTTYYNRVSTDLGSGWGARRSFSTRTAESISYVTSPADGAVDRNTTLNISSNLVAGASSYTIQLSQDSLFSEVAFEMTGPTRTLLFSGLQSGTTYYNRVTTNAPGATGYGERRSFTTKGIPPDAPAARLSSNASEHQLDEELAEFEINLYPNPFREKLVFKIESRGEKQAAVSLMDLNGRQIHESVEPTNTSVEINKSMPSGVYLLRVKAGTHQKMIRVIKTD